MRIEQELSYRKQIARQLRTQYAEGIYKHKYYTVTLRITQVHWKRNHWIDHTRLSSSRVIWRYRDLEVRLIGEKSLNFYTQPVFIIPRRGWHRHNFVNIFGADKNRMIGLPYGEKLWQYVKPFSSDTRTSRTDRHRRTDGRTHNVRQTDLLYQYRASGTIFNE